MQKNQKYSKDYMYRAIAQWQGSGLSQVKFCSGEKLSVKTFSYWLRKYRQEKGVSFGGSKKARETFIPLKVSGTKTERDPSANFGRIEVSFPNGVRLSCPAGIDIGQLKTLINF